MAAQRMAWRTRRWQIAHLRRHALEVRPPPAHAFTASCANVYAVRYHLVRHDNGCSSCSVGFEAQFCLNVLWYGLINGNMCQPLLWHQPGRYQVCLTPILKAVQQALFYDWRVCRRCGKHRAAYQSRTNLYLLEPPSIQRPSSERPGIEPPTESLRGKSLKP